MDIDPDADVPGMLAPIRISVGILAPCFVGWDLQIFLCGLSLSLFYAHLSSSSFSRSSFPVKSLSIFIMLLNLSIAGCNLMACIRWGTTQKRTAEGLWSQASVDCLQPALVGVIGFVVQSWFARRSAMLFSAKWSRFLFVSVAGSTILLALGGSISVAVTNYKFMLGTKDDPGLDVAYGVTNGLWLWTSSFVDCLNTCTLCYLLKTRVAGFNERTDSVLNKIVKLSLESASYTAFFALTGAVIFSSLPNDSYYTGDIGYCFWVPLPSLYALSYFSTLASRDRLAQELTEGGPITSRKLPHTGLSHNEGGEGGLGTRRPGMAPRVGSFFNVTVDVEVATDDGHEERKGSSLAGGGGGDRGEEQEEGDLEKGLEVGLGLGWGQTKGREASKERGRSDSRSRMEDFA